MSYDQKEREAPLRSLTNKAAASGPDSSNPPNQSTLTRTVTDASSTARERTWQQVETNFSKEDPPISTGSQTNVNATDWHSKLEKKHQQADIYVTIMGKTIQIYKDISHIRGTLVSIYDKDPSQANTNNVSTWDRLTDGFEDSVRELEAHLSLAKHDQSLQGSVNPMQGIAEEFASLAKDASITRTHMESMLERADQAAKLRDTATEFRDKLAGANQTLLAKSYLGLIPSGADIAMSALHQKVEGILSAAEQASHDITEPRDFDEQTQSFTRMSEDYDKLHSRFYQSAEDDDDDDDEDDVNGSQLNGIILALLGEGTDLTKPWNLESPGRPSSTPTSGEEDTLLASPRL